MTQYQDLRVLVVTEFPNTNYYVCITSSFIHTPMVTTHSPLSSAITAFDKHIKVMKCVFPDSNEEGRKQQNHPKVV